MPFVSTTAYTAFLQHLYLLLVMSATAQWQVCDMHLIHASSMRQFHLSNWKNLSKATEMRQAYYF